MTVKNITVKYLLDFPVAGVPTTLVVIPCADFRRCTLTVKNPDALQTLDVLVYRRPTRDAEMAQSEYEGFRNIGPLLPRCNDLDIEGVYELELRGQASGAGISAVEVHGAMTP